MEITQSKFSTITKLTTILNLLFLSNLSLTQILLPKSQTTSHAFSTTLSSLRIHSHLHSSTQNEPPAPQTLKIAIVGSGPSGLLLAHSLLTSSDIVSSSITLLESRSDPRQLATSSSTTTAAGRAYALGIGVRGRTAIQSCDEDGAVWDAVRSRGFASGKFQLYVNPKFAVTLRDDDRKRRIEAFWGNLRRIIGGGGDADEGEKGMMNQEEEEEEEPSILIYQTDLCGALLDQLEHRATNGGKDVHVKMHFNAQVQHVNLGDDQDGRRNCITVTTRTTDKQVETSELMGPFDLIVGCDGVNSKVRDSIQQYAPETFRVTRKELPGEFKVARLTQMPPLLDPAAVSLLLPSSSSSKKEDEEEDEDAAKKDPKGNTQFTTTAFVEPVVDGNACVLFAGRTKSSNGVENIQDEIDPILATLDPSSSMNLQQQPGEENDQTKREQLTKSILDRFPLLKGVNDIENHNLATQLLSQRAASASSVKCNTFHYRNAVLVGDAAHATGGVSGQGVNSALVDSMVLGQCLERYHSSGVGGDASLNMALLEYSKCQVPEAWALYDLSFGNTASDDDGGGESTVPVWKRVKRTLALAKETVLGGLLGIGKAPLQTLLATSLESFVSVRRGREDFFDVLFPEDDWFYQEIEKLAK